MKTVRSLGLKTQELRLRAGLSQEELAVKAWVSRKWLNEFENGKTSVNASKVLDVLQALGYEVDVVPITPVGNEQ
jgi:HTH-type transcriptional regulator/antitoxin HipB